MVNNEKKIDMVLAMFDDEDIPYINTKIQLDYYEKKDISLQKIKEVGVCNDRQRK